MRHPSLTKHSTWRIMLTVGLMVGLFYSMVVAQSDVSNGDWEKEADKYEKQGDFIAATKVYTNALDVFSKRKNHSEYVRCLTKLALLQKNNRNFRGALGTIVKADSIYKHAKLESPLLLGEIKHQRGTLMIIFSDNKKAVRLLEQAVEEKTKVLDPHDTLLSSTYNNLGMANLNINRFAEAIKNINSAISALEKKKENKLNLLARFHENLGIIFAQMGDYSKAREYIFSSLNEKLRLAKTKNDTVNLASAYLNLGQIETTLSNLDSAYNYLNTAENLFLSISNSESYDLDVVYNNKGNLYSLQGDYEKALAYYNKALIMLRRKSPENSRIKEIQMNIGHIYFVRQEYEKSVEFYLASISKDPSSDANIKTYRNLGKSLEALGRYNEAGDFFKKAIKISSQKYGDNHYEVSASHLHYGNVLNYTNRLDEALIQYNKALKINTKLFGNKNRDVAECFMRLAELELKRGNNQTALEHYQKALIALVEKFDNYDPHANPSNSFPSPDYYLMNVFAGKGAAFYALYQQKKQKKDLYLSFNNYNLYASVVNQIRSNLSSDESNLVISSRLRDLLGGALRTTTALFNLTGDNYYLTQAFQFAEKGKSAILMAEISDQEDLIGSVIPQQTRQEAKKLRNNIASYKKLIHEEYKTSKPDQQKIDLWREKVFALEKEQEILTEQIKEANPDYLKYSFGNKTPSPRELQPLLNDETILEYTLTSDAIYSFLINRDTFVLKVTPIDSRFTALVSNYVENIRHGLLADPQISFNNFVSYSQQLHHLLIEPNKSFLSTKKIMIVPDGILGYIPFETLIQSKPSYSIPDYKNLDYLIKEYSVRYSYIASLPFMDRPERKAPRKVFGGFAPIYEQNVPRNSMDSIAGRPLLTDIPGIRVEVKKIASHLAHADLFLNEKATETKFKQVSGDYEVLHLALHTLVDNENPMFSKLVFANSSDSTEDQLLNAYEVYNLDLSARLAVLSSCNTGNGQLVYGEGVMSLARGFLYAQVPSVVMTLWEAEDDDATGIMPLFYENLKQGLYIDQALHITKLNYLASVDRLRSHPYFWSAYVMIGVNDPITTLENKFPYILVLSIIAAIAILGFIIAKVLRNKKRS